MKKLIGKALVLGLMTLAAACHKQDTTNITSENTFVSDEISDGTATELDNSVDLVGNLDAPAPAPNAN